MSAKRERVNAFIHKMRTKTKVFGIIYEDDRPKNTQTLMSLEITPKDRDDIVLRIRVEDYSEGPIPEAFFGGDSEMYVFGKMVKDHEIYIKITLGRSNNQVICISFHIAEHPMEYPFK